jgi:hypothetical protein
VTSTGEVLAPCAADFIEVLLDQDLRFRHLFGLKAEVCGQFDDRLDPELRFAVGMLKERKQDRGSENLS